MAATYWNCWTNNYRGLELGYVTHAFEEGAGERTLCGVRLQESGLIEVTDDESVGCIKCNAILRKRGVTARKTES